MFYYLVHYKMAMTAATRYLETFTSYWQLGVGLYIVGSQEKTDTAAIRDAMVSHGCEEVSVVRIALMEAAAEGVSERLWDWLSTSVDRSLKAIATPGDENLPTVE